MDDPRRPCLQQLGGDVIGGEDCLKVRIYSPEVPFNGSAPAAPVMLYLHGSSFVAGDAWNFMYKGLFMLAYTIQSLG